MFLFFDTETTGLPDYNKDLVDPSQPHVLQLALLLADEGGKEILTFKTPIIPEGFEIDERDRDDNGRPTAYSFNKLGGEMLTRYGISMKTALNMFRLFESKATVKIAHNYRFDGFLMKSAHARQKMDPINPPIDKFCTMKAIQALAADLKPKSVSLASCYEHCTGKTIENAHDALADVRACKEVFFWLLNKGFYIPQPRVVPGQAT